MAAVGDIRSHSYNVYGLTEAEAEAVRMNITKRAKAHFKVRGFTKITGPWDTSVERQSDGTWLCRGLFQMRTTRKALKWDGEPWDAAAP